MLSTTKIPQNAKSKQLRSEVCSVCNVSYAYTNAYNHKKTLKHRRNCLSFKDNKKGTVFIFSKNQKIGQINYVASPDTIRNIDFENNIIKDLFKSVLLNKYLEFIEKSEAILLVPKEHKLWYSAFNNATLVSDEGTTARYQVAKSYGKNTYI